MSLYAVVNPATGETVKAYPTATDDQIHTAIATADAAFKAWNRTAPEFTPPALEEQINHAFHLRLAAPPRRERWEWQERSGGDVVEHRVAFRWVSLDEAARTLWPHQAMWIDAVPLSLRHPA